MLEDLGHTPVQKRQPNGTHTRGAIIATIETYLTDCEEKRTDPTATEFSKKQGAASVSIQRGVYDLEIRTYNGVVEDLGHTPIFKPQPNGTHTRKTIITTIDNYIKDCK